ncbi:MAG: hypothetical protein ACTSRG_26830 [Candidatus Helarchaeota archaeon]
MKRNKKSDIKKLRKLESIAQTAENDLHSKCADIAMFLAPMVDFEISVGFQPSDGFVVIFEKNVFDAMVNEGLEEFYNNVTKDRNYYKVSEREA